MLERELLARKTDLVLFLNRILTRATESLDPTVILDHAREDLELLLPMGFGSGYSGTSSPSPAPRG